MIRDPIQTGGFSRVAGTWVKKCQDLVEIVYGGAWLGLVAAVFHFMQLLRAVSEFSIGHGRQQVPSCQLLK